MRTTLDIPDDLLRRAKARARERGIPFRQFVTEALQAKLREPEKRWMKTVGGLKHLREENVRIQQIIDAEFETIDPEGWV